MKKDWNKPTLLVLDVKMTMAGQDGPATDAAFPNGTLKGDLTFC
ncbi:paeninodin family lasso peptide [Bacillus timonensis]|nr:paeninodin family lasso peptide [Bacillus timonensis]